MGISGPKKVSMSASITSRGCQFGSMPGTAPSVGRSSGVSIAYQKGGLGCDCLGKIRFQSCAQQLKYLKDNNLIFNCKLTGGIGRQPWTKNCAMK
jgi:hypothetical protein